MKVKIGQGIRFAGSLDELLAGISELEIAYLRPSLKGNGWTVTDPDPRIPDMPHLIEIGMDFGTGLSHFFYVLINDVALLSSTT